MYYLCCLSAVELWICRCISGMFLLRQPNYIVFSISRAFASSWNGELVVLKSIDRHSLACQSPLQIMHSSVFKSAREVSAVCSCVCAFDLSACHMEMCQYIVIRYCYNAGDRIHYCVCFWWMTTQNSIKTMFRFHMSIQTNGVALCAMRVHTTETTEQSVAHVDDEANLQDIGTVCAHLQNRNSRDVPRFHGIGAKAWAESNGMPHRHNRNQ